jgi:nucleotide-binding universal stress UspA family protein
MQPPPLGHESVSTLPLEDERRPRLVHDAKLDAKLEAKLEARSGPRSIVVGVDGSAASLEALRWAVGLAGTSGAPVSAVYAFTPSYAEVSPAQYEFLQTEAAQTLGVWCAETGVAESVDPFVVGGGPGALLTIAHQSDLLVVGTRGDYGIAHLHLGSVAHHLVHHTSVPLAIVPSRVAGGRISRLVVGVDGSVGSGAAVTFAASLARALDATVVVVHAAAPGTEVPVVARVREWAAPLEAEGVGFEVEISTDVVPVEAMCRAIAAKPDTLAVVGTRGLGGFSGLRLGGVATHLAHTCEVAVALVPAHHEPSVREGVAELA